MLTGVSAIALSSVLSALRDDAEPERVNPDDYLPPFNPLAPRVAVACLPQLLCYVATTFGEKSTASVEEEIMAYQNVRTRRWLARNCLCLKKQV